MQIIYYQNFSGQTEKVEVYCSLSAKAVWKALKESGFKMLSSKP